MVTMPADPARSFDIVESYRRILREDEEVSMPIAAVLSLVELVEQSNVGTMFELVEVINAGKERLKSAEHNALGLNAGAELFSAFVGTFAHESTDIEYLKTVLIREGREYAAQSRSRREKISEYAFKFIKDGAVILTHSYSRVVMQVLLHAHRSKRITVYVTEARPRNLGSKTIQLLQKAGVPCHLTLDWAVGYLIDKVDMVLVGTEAVLESGGLVNALGSYQMALIAKAAHKPFYAVAESYKFHRLFPLSQDDLADSAVGMISNSSSHPQNDSSNDDNVASKSQKQGSLMRCPEVDYTR